MLPIGSPENMLRAIGEQAVHGLLTIALYCGVARARHNAALAAAAASAEWRESDAAAALLAQHSSRRRAAPEVGQTRATRSLPGVTAAALGCHCGGGAPMCLVKLCGSQCGNG